MRPILEYASYACGSLALFLFVIGWVSKKIVAEIFFGLLLTCVVLLLGAILFWLWSQGGK